jgi:hypothetical protein
VSQVQVAEARAGVLGLFREDGSQELVFEKLRETIEAILDAATPAGDSRDVVARMHEAVVEARTSLMEMRERVAVTEQQLATERKELEVAERRGKLAEGIGDQETVAVAERFAAKHRERVEVLGRKLSAQRDELALAEREFSQMRDELKQARAQRGVKGPASDRIESAWRNIENAGGTRRDVDLGEELLRTQMDAAAREAAADEQLRELKKKMGR